MSKETAMAVAFFAALRRKMLASDPKNPEPKIFPKKTKGERETYVKHMREQKPPPDR
jgi:hypothetical protein